MLSHHYCEKKEGGGAKFVAYIHGREGQVPQSWQESCARWVSISIGAFSDFFVCRGAPETRINRFNGKATRSVSSAFALSRPLSFVLFLFAVSLVGRVIIEPVAPRCSCDRRSSLTLDLVRLIEHRLASSIDRQQPVPSE